MSSSSGIWIFSSALLSVTNLETRCIMGLILNLMNQVCTPLSVCLCPDLPVCQCSKLWRDDTVSSWLEFWAMKGCIGNARGKRPYKDLLGTCELLHCESEAKASEIWMAVEICMKWKPLDSPLPQLQFDDVSHRVCVCYSHIGPNYFYFCCCAFLWGDGGPGCALFSSILEEKTTGSHFLQSQHYIVPIIFSWELWNGIQRNALGSGWILI